MMTGFSLLLRAAPYIAVVVAVWWIYHAGQAHERDRQALRNLQQVQAQMQKRLEIGDWLNDQAALENEARTRRAEMLENHVAAYQRELQNADAEADRLNTTLTHLTTELKKAQDDPQPEPSTPRRSAGGMCALTDRDIERLLEIDGAD